jgi:hypothetical protein
MFVVNQSIAAAAAANTYSYYGFTNTYTHLERACVDNSQRVISLKTHRLFWNHSHSHTYEALRFLMVILNMRDKQRFSSSEVTMRFVVASNAA